MPKLIRIWTGDAKGKTTAALGTAMRAIGHKKKVIVIQWLKGRKNIGEIKISKMLNRYYKIYQFGTKEFVNPAALRSIDYELAKKGVEFARRVVKKEKPFLLILDELALAHSLGLVNIDEIKAILSDVPKDTVVFITGRQATDELMALADYVNEIREIKRPKKMPKAIMGIEY